MTYPSIDFGLYTRYREPFGAGWLERCLAKGFGSLDAELDRIVTRMAPRLISYPRTATSFNEAFPEIAPVRDGDRIEYELLENLARLYADRRRQAEGEEAAMLRGVGEAPCDPIEDEVDVAKAYTDLIVALAQKTGYSTDNPLTFLLGGCTLTPFWRAAPAERCRRANQATTACLLGSSLEDLRKIIRGEVGT